MMSKECSMKKKVILVLMLALLAPAFIFADIMQLGVNVGYGLNYDQLFNQEEGEEPDYFAAENFSFAPELRLNVLFLQLDVVPALSFGEDYFMADTQATLGIQFKILDVVRLGAGAGISIPISQKDGVWAIGGESFSEAVDALGNARMLYKASLGIPLSIVELTANWIIPAGGSFNEGNFEPDIEASTFSVGVLLNLF